MKHLILAELSVSKQKSQTGLKCISYGGVFGEVLIF